MFKQLFLRRPLQQLLPPNGNILPLSLLVCLVLTSTTGCHLFKQDNKTLTTSDGETIELDDATVKQYVEEWHNSKPSIERLAEMEGDLAFLLAEVSKMSDLGQVPGLARNPAYQGMLDANGQPITSTGMASTGTMPTGTAATGGMAQGNNQSQGSLGLGANQPQGSQPSNTSQFIPVPGDNSAGFSNAGGFGEAAYNPSYNLCPEPFANSYKKSIGFVSFPRVKPLSSNLGALHQVEQHLPMLIGANLRNRHTMLTPAQIGGSLANVNNYGESATAAQVQALARQNRVQFFVSGEVDDMSLSFPDTLGKPSYFTRFVSGAHNFLHINTPLDKRSRVFSFTLQVRDGFTGQLIFNNQYQTFGKWKAAPETDMGFGSPRFWLTDYGKQVQHLVARASDDLASAVRCQPYMARIDSRPHQKQVVIHSGANNGLRTGDTLELYQLVYQPVTGSYQQFDTRLMKRNGRVYLTEIYPSHSIGHVVDETLLSGQYLVKAL